MKTLINQLLVLVCLALIAAPSSTSLEIPCCITGGGPLP
ncbi:hypothetical protein Ddep01_01053 [Deinococcus depolymerans]